MSATDTRRLLDDLVAFAEDLFSRMGATADPRISTFTPRQYAAYKAALKALSDAIDAESPAERAVDRLDTEALSWAGDAFFEGVRFGLATDHLRRTLLAMHDVPPCPTCLGRGQVRDARCAECGGDGFAPLAAA